MTFDPLFHEVPMPAALRAELGIPEGAELWYLRFIGEVVRFPTVDVGPDGTPEPPRRRPRKAHLRAGYEIVYVYSLDAGTGTAPMWWGPGQLWLTRLRFGEDPVYGERRPPRPDDPHGEPRYSVTEEGNMAKASASTELN